MRLFLPWVKTQGFRKQQSAFAGKDNSEIFAREGGLLDSLALGFNPGRLSGAFLAILLCLAIDAGAAPAAPAVTPAGAATIQRAIAAKKGRIVVVNFWATWCGPCVAEYPYLVKLQTQYGAKGVTVIAVSADMAKDIHSKVQPFLVRQKAMFPQYLERADDPQDFINAFDPKWQGDLPRTLIYDRQGRLAKTLSGGQTYAQFVAAVTPLLKP